MSAQKHDVFVRVMNNTSDLTEDEVIEQFIAMDEFDACHSGTYECPDCGEFEYCGICQHCCECSGCYR